MDDTKKLTASSLDELIDIPIPKPNPVSKPVQINSNRMSGPSAPNNILPNGMAGQLVISGGGSIGSPGQVVARNWNVNSNPFTLQLDDTLSLSLKELQDAKMLLTQKIIDIDLCLEQEGSDEDKRNEMTLTKLILKYILFDITRMSK